MAVMRGRRAASKRDPDGSEESATAIVGDGSGDGSGDDHLTLHIGINL